MSDTLDFQDQRTSLESFAGIKVVGIGGAGCNAVSRMISGGPQRRGISGNQHRRPGLFFLCDADQRIHIGGNITKGLGAGSDPEVWKKKP